MGLEEARKKLEKEEIRFERNISIVKSLMNELPYIQFPVGDTTYMALPMDMCHVIVKVNINDFESGLLNGDLCKVIAQPEDEDIVIVKRLSDELIAVVKKKKVNLPMWRDYYL